MTRRTTRVAVTAGLLVAAIAVFVLLTAAPKHRVSVVVPAAANVVKGTTVTAGGRPIGDVTSIDPVNNGRAARITMHIGDDRYWPLTSATGVQVRFGGTVSFVNRYILITPRRNGTPLPDGGQLPAANVEVPVEVDTLVSKITPQVRRGIRRLIINGADTMDLSAEPLHRALAVAPDVASSSASVLGDLTRNQDELSGLVHSTGRVVAGIDEAQPGVRELLGGLAETLAAVADKQRELRVSLIQFPPALRQTRRTLALADDTLRRAARLTDRVAPGVRQLRAIAQPLDRVLRHLRAVAPGARSTLGAVARSAPTTRALDSLAAITPRLGSIGEQATKELDCIRPYTPEIVMFGTTWGDWMSPVDNRDHLIRAVLQSFLPANHNSDPRTPADVVKANPGTEYAFPRPPGALAGQPWFQPQCGAGEDALDPTKDQEAKGALTDPSGVGTKTRSGRATR